MPLYRCMLESFIDLQANSELDAEIKAVEELNGSFKAGRSGFICWEIDEVHTEKTVTPPVSGE